MLVEFITLQNWWAIITFITFAYNFTFAISQHTLRRHSEFESTSSVIREFNGYHQSEANSSDSAAPTIESVTNDHLAPTELRQRVYSIVGENWNFSIFVDRIFFFVLCRRLVCRVHYAKKMQIIHAMAAAIIAIYGH